MAPANYRFQPDAADAASFADEGWWQVYQDPDACSNLIREALANNLDVGIAAARVDQARAALGSTRLQQLPQLSGSAGCERRREHRRMNCCPAYRRSAMCSSCRAACPMRFDFWGKYRRATEAARAQLLAIRISPDRM